MAKPNDRRRKRSIHFLDENGMLLCHPRDREAAHRAQDEGIASDRIEDVSCRKCIDLYHRKRSP